MNTPIVSLFQYFASILHSRDGRFAQGLRTIGTVCQNNYTRLARIRWIIPGALFGLGLLLCFRMCQALNWRLKDLGVAMHRLPLLSERAHRLKMMQ